LAKIALELKCISCFAAENWPMKQRLTFRVLVGALVTAAVVSTAAAEQPRQRLLMDFGWKFIPGDSPGAEAVAFDDSPWHILNLPHDWSIEGPYSETNSSGGGGGYLLTGVGWYRKEFTMPESSRGRKAVVEFDGVYRNSDVWLNGHHLGHWPYGYSSFHYDLTPFLNFGSKTNVLAVRVDNSMQPNSRWYSGSGICRHVWMTVTDPLHVAHWGTYVTTPKAASDLATVRIRTRVQNEYAARRAVTLVSQIVNADGQVVAAAEANDRIQSGGEFEFDQTVELPKPQLWSPETPYLYRVRSLVKSGGQAADDYETWVGIRDIQYDVDRGFLLNGQPVKMLGMCLHHDGGAVGAAVPEGVWERRLRLLKEMGCNAIRMSHNPPAPELLDLCDRLGFLVMDEAFDEWLIGKTRQGYARYFNEWSIKDLKAMLHRDRNHPSVVMWSVGNEIGEQTRTNGAAVLRPLVETCHREDFTRPVTAACDNVYTDTGGAKLEFLNLLDVVGYNYVDRWGSRRETFYSDDRHRFPQRKMVGTEDVCVGGVRGSYDMGPVETESTARGRYFTSMIRSEQLWKFVKLHDYVAGYFMWTGIDYLGESRWPWKSASSGVLDTCGFPKDGYYFYQSQWTTKPMLHLFPHWNWKGREGQVIPVICYTSCDTVELFLNGKSYGAKSLEFPRQGTAGGWNRYARPQVFSTTADLHLSWDVSYEPGTLKAVGRKNGKVVCTEEIRTADTPAAIELLVDREKLHAGTRDVAHFTARVMDAQGNIVPTADPLITFDVQGSGVLIGVDNGNPASHENYKSNHRQAFNGLCLAIVQSTREPGKVRLTARAEGLREAAIEIETQPGPLPATLPATIMP
jgi:beta-galactosidase